MRFDALHLARFGPFTDRRLVFDEGAGPGLCVVYGSNEAGKSSALRAMRAFLYEIPRQTSDNFVHPHQDLQVGARLRFQDGLRCEILRRKGSKQTLRGEGPGGEAGIEQLEQLVRAIPESLFIHLYGLDHPALAAGAQALLDDRGEVGRTLFGAGLGVAHLRKVIEGLESEAAALFKGRGKQKINQALAEWAETQKKIRNQQLDPGEWERQARLVDRLAAGLVSLENSIEATTAEILRTRRRIEASEALERARTERGQILAAIEGDEKRLQALSLAPKLVELGDAIEAVLQRLSAYGDTQAQLPRREDELARVEGELDAVARALGVEVGTDTAMRLARVAEREATLRERVAEALLFADRLEKARDAERDARVNWTTHAGPVESLGEAAQEAFEAAATGSAAGGDPEPLEQALRQANRLGAIDSAILALRRQREALVGNEDRLRAQLALTGRSQSELESLTLPSRSTIAVHARGFASHADEAGRLHRLRAALQEQHVQLEAELVLLRREGGVPDERELAACRAERDTLWRQLRRRLFDPSSDGPGETVNPELGDRFESSLRAADQLADRLRSEADRVAQAAQLAARSVRLERERLEQERAERIHAEAGRSVEAAWRADWPVALGEPGAPEVRGEWREGFERLMDVFAERGRVESELADEEVRRREARSLLEGLLGPEAASAEERLEPLVERAELERQHRIAARDRARDRQRARESAEQQLARAVADREQAVERLERWRAAWHDELSEVGLSPTLQPREAGVQIQKLHSLLGRRTELRHRVEAMRRDARDFERDCLQLAAVVQPEFAELAPSQAALRLKRALDQSRDRATRTDELERKLAEARDRLAVVDHAIASGEVERERTGGLVDPAELAATLESLDARQAEQQRERSARSGELGEQRKALRDMDGRTRIAELAEQAASHLATVPADVRRYADLRLARRILEAEIEAYRRQNQGPILEKAGAFFSALTLAAYRGVLADEGEDGRMRLVALRADDREVRVEGLSAGTRDQLFLALRLAAIADSVERSEPMPLVADDVLVDFDEDRSRAALDVLADFGKRTQVLLFTHHRHVAEQAASLGTDRARVVEL